MSYKICALIPTYNHHLVLKDIVGKLRKAKLEIIIIDDGSNTETQVALTEIETDDPEIHVFRHPINQGKGAAIETGLRRAAEGGFTHALQVDADGQHCLDNLQTFLDLSKKNPQVLLSGLPEYDTTIPLGRRIGRWFTHIWVWIETLSLKIKESMCGYRIYPIHKTLAITQNFSVGSRMDFDIEILVRLFWEGTPVLMSPVKVTYPEGNLSNFNVISDNLRITKMHTRLVFLMLLNLRKIISNRPNYTNLEVPAENINWASIKERGSLFGLFFLAGCYRLFGKRACLVLGAPIVFYFYLTGTKQRQASQVYLNRVFSKIYPEKKPRPIDSFKHYMNFFEMCLDKFAGWIGHMNTQQIEEKGLNDFKKVLSHGYGGLFLVSHLGNMEFCRAVSSSEHKNRLHILLHSKNAQLFNKIIKLYNPNAEMNILEVTNIGPDTILFLKSRVDAGDWVVIAADRVPVHGNARTSSVPFLGYDAAFSHGPFVLASLLECPVYTVIAVREGQKFRIFLDHFSDKITLLRKDREDQLKGILKKYAEHLEHYCLRYPYQWFNFFDFWK